MLLEKKNVYIVEDNTDNIYVIMSILKKHGALIRVDWRATGSADYILKAMPIDIIILDLMLGGGHSGFAVMEYIQKEPELAGIPVVAVSAADPSLAMPKTIEAGFAGFISKPVNYDLFPKQIAALIDGKPVWFAA